MVVAQYRPAQLFEIGFEAIRQIETVRFVVVDDVNVFISEFPSKLRERGTLARIRRANAKKRIRVRIRAPEGFGGIADRQTLAHHGGPDLGKRCGIRHGDLGGSDVGVIRSDDCQYGVVARKTAHVRGALLGVVHARNGIVERIGLKREARREAFPRLLDGQQGTLLRAESHRRIAARRG